MIRTRSALEQWRDIGQQLAQRVQDLTGELPDVLRRDNREREREEFFRRIPNQTRAFIDHLLDKNLVLYESNDDLRFWISDNPVSKNNTLNPGNGIVGTLGLAVTGIEVYLPVSSRLTLCFMCPSIAAAYQLKFDETARLGGLIHQAAHEYLWALRTGRPIGLTVENTRFQNSLQVAYAERYVFSNSEVFDDARQMVQRDVDLSHGPRASAT
jgi:hypothetical protein